MKNLNNEEKEEPVTLNLNFVLKGTQKSYTNWDNNAHQLVNGYEQARKTMNGCVCVNSVATLGLINFNPTAKLFNDYFNFWSGLLRCEKTKYQKSILNSIAK